MKIIIDNNILFSLMNPLSASSYLFSLINADFIAPEFINEEFEKYEDLCQKKSGLNQKNFKKRKEKITKSITFIPSKDYSKFLEISAEAISDPNDIDFLALAISQKAPIWSNDRHFKNQNMVEVFSTRELMEELIRGNV